MNNSSTNCGTTLIEAVTESGAKKTGEIVVDRGLNVIIDFVKKNMERLKSTLGQCLIDIWIMQPDDITRYAL